MANKLIECWLCGALHDYCPTCGQTNGWKFKADTREHYQILTIKEAFESGVFDKDKAVAEFALHDVKAENDLSWMIPEVEKEIRAIIGEKPVKTTKKSKLYKDED